MVLEYAQKIAPLSVRKAEELIAGFLGTPGSDPTLIPGRYLRPKLCIAEHQLGKTLATPVAIIESQGKGHIRIPFADLYEFERLYTFLTGEKMELAYPPRSEKAG